MRTGPVIFWVMVAAALGALVMILGRGGNTRPEDGREAVSLGIDLAEVRAIRAGNSVELARSPGGGWLVRWDSDGTRLAWPANVELARAGLRVLAAAEFARRGDDAGFEAAGSVRVEHGDAPVVIRWGGTPIAGRVAAELDIDGEPQAVWMEERLARALSESNLMQWRDARVMTLGSRVVGADVSLPGRSVTLIEREGVWRIGDASVLGLDPARISETLDAIGLIEAQSFDETAAPGPAAATMRVVGLDGSERTLEVVGAANAAGTLMRARVRGARGEDAIGPVDVLIKAEPLGALSPDAWSYLRGTAVDGARVDVASVELISRTGGVLARATRSIDGWNTAVDEARMDALVDLLTELRASNTGEGVEANLVGTIRVRDAALADPIEVVLARDGAGAYVLLVRDGAFEIAFEYADDAAQGLLGWAAGLME